MTSLFDNYPSEIDFQRKIVELKSKDNDINKKLMYYMTLNVRAFKMFKDVDPDDMKKKLGEKDYHFISKLIEIYETNKAHKYMVNCITYEKNDDLIQYIEENKNDKSTLFIGQNLKLEMDKIIKAKDFHINNVMKSSNWNETEKEDLIATIELKTELYKNQVKKLEILIA